MKALHAALVVLVAAVVLTTVAAASPAYTASASLPSYRVAIDEHIEHGWYLSHGKRGHLSVELRFGSSGTRSWRLRSVDPLIPMNGQYAQITGGGRRFPAGGHQGAWYARLFGVVSRPGAAKQRVLIKLNGRANGVFVLTPLEPGVLKRDSGTYHSFETG